MATAEQCQKALESLIGRIADLDAQDRQAHLLDRTLSCRVPDLGVTFVTRISPDGGQPVLLACATTPQAQVRFTANSDVVVSIAADPGGFLRAWLSGKLKVQASLFDLLHLRKLM